MAKLTQSDIVQALRDYLEKRGLEATPDDQGCTFNFHYDPNCADRTAMITVEVNLEAPPVPLGPFR